MFRLTVQEWRGRLSRVLTDCFSECWFSLLLKEGGDKPSSGEIDAYKESEKRMIHLDFSPSTFVGNDQIRELYEWGVIPFKIFGQYCMANCSLPVEEMCKAPPPDNPLGVGLPDPNAELKLKEKELGVKQNELKFKEQESKDAVKREEKAAKEAKAEEKKTKEDEEKKKTTGKKRKDSSGSGGSSSKKAKNDGKIELVISTK